jgi:hypothetical protein
MPADDDDLNIDEHPDDDELALPGLRKAAKEGKKAIERNAQLEREMLFLKAGIDTDSKLGKMLLTTFEGDDLDALKAEAIEIGLLPDPADPAQQPEQGRQDDQLRQSLHDGLSTGQPSGQTAPETKHPRHAALENYQVAIRDGADEGAARTQAMESVLEAAAQGDKRVFVDKAKHRAAAEEYDRLANSRSR